MTASAPTARDARDGVGSPRRRPAVLAWLTLAIVGWATIAILAASLLATAPPRAAFDLELLLRAGRAAAAGLPMYDPSILAGNAPNAKDLFFSYPPPVGQALAVFAGLPSPVVFAAWSIGALVLLAWVAVRLRHLVARTVYSSPTVAVAVIAVAAMSFPFVVAILFGNLDAFFPALYGLALVGALSPRRRHQMVGGVAVALATVAKIYPGGLGLWFLVRGATDDAEGRRGVWRLISAAVLTGLGVLVVSLIVGGVAPWQDYLRAIPVIGRSELTNAPNVAPAARLAVLLGGGSDLARAIQIPVALVALGATAFSAWRVRDVATSLAIAAAASLVLLPVSWIHYPAAMIPFGALAVLRAPTRDVIGLVALAVLGGSLALVWLPAMWIGVIAVVAGVGRAAAVSPRTLRWA